MARWHETILGPGDPEHGEGAFRITDWLEMRDRLRSGQYDADWERAIAAFERRFAARFTRPADILLEHDSDGRVPDGRGFAVLALDCLLIESLYGYQRGRHTQVGGTNMAFEKILLEEPFRPHFEREGRAARFGRAVRNGILHDGETRDGWVVWKASSEDSPMIDPQADGRTRIHRELFHRTVKTYVDTYFATLRAGTDSGVALREAFRCRVNELCAESEPTPGTDRGGGGPGGAASRPVPRTSA